ncbi:sugar phosphate isomerase/epimerase family protein [Rhodopirellula sp. MGV]|uniref:sugar phosphate isomerase/epimerase family protein n=1 Tax=Rhodopirellula sp. MGV TaxID=2023130 RepID=UPI000B9699CD|nr:sugar phosphate isomerase/epimerase family protein [Rhodopirellula sp. MGV]OYP33904.1 xylose isomerase [Rhodopirellula sp. MGV]PNY34113.1 xylose isomerase [Rhodopirellula baltica]
MTELKLAIRLDSLRLPLKKSLDVAARMGIHSVELDGRGEVHPEGLTDTGLRHFKKLLDERNLRVASIRFQTRRGYDNPNDLQRRVDATKSAMQLAYKLGARSVINHIGFVPDDESDPRFETLSSVLQDLGRYGARVGAFLCAETGAESGETLRRVLEKDDEGFIGVAFNPGQLVVNRYDAIESLKVLKDRVQVICATDGVLDLAAGRGIRVPIGEGTVDFPMILATMDDVDFNGPLLVGREDSTLDEIRQGVNYLANLMRF